MKRVICLYRVSTVGQVDHDDIPMQKIACREFAATHPDWEIVDEISEKGVSGYKVSTNARDAIIEIKRRAVAKEFDVLLVFMFDRLGRREDETPFVVQWFVQQGIEVWSTREGEQRFDTHVDKLLNYIRFWQASGESEKTAIRVRTKHLQMIGDGQYRGGLIPYGYKLEQRGRVNKKNKPVPDMVVDDDEAAVVREIFHLLVNKGYGTNRVANYLNDKGIKTKRGKSLWRGTTIRALIGNPIYIGHMHMGEELSPKHTHLQIIDDDLFERCRETVKGRATSLQKAMTMPERTDTGSLLSGLLYCKECGAKLYFSHGTNKKTLADGTIRVYGRESYRCYTKLNNPKGCNGPSSYSCDLINDAVLVELRRFLNVIKNTPNEVLMEQAQENHDGANEVAYRRAEQEYFEANKQISALEDQVIKALTGENSLDISIVNSMMPKYREKMELAQQRMEEAKAKMEEEKEESKEARREIKELASWAEVFDDSQPDVRKMIIARLVERIDVGADYSVKIRLKINMRQYTGEVA